jgi:hypothetical protein
MRMLAASEPVLDGGCAGMRSLQGEQCLLDWLSEAPL